LQSLIPSWSYGSWIYNYLCNRCLSPLLNAGTVPTVCLLYIFSFYYRLLKKTSWVAIVKKKYELYDSVWWSPLTRTGTKCTLEWNSVVIKDRERDVQVWKNVKVYFKWGVRSESFTSTLRDVLNSILISVCCLFHIKSPFS
jgi:hypothetical protein